MCFVVGSLDLVLTLVLIGTSFGTSRNHPSMELEVDTSYHWVWSPNNNKNMKLTLISHLIRHA